MTFWRVLWTLAMALQLQAAQPAETPPGRRPFTTVGVEDGLPSESVISLAQDAEGFIWIGTEHGLVRYNGGQCRHWTREHGLPSDFIAQIVPIADGGLWLGTQGGLVRFKEGRFEPAVLNGVPSRTPANQMALDGKGRLWLVTAKGMFRQQEGLAFSALPLDPKENTGALVSGRAKGTMFLALAEGVRAYLPDGTTRTWGTAEGLPQGMPTILVEDGGGRLWVGSGRTLVMKAAGETRFQDRSRLLPASLSPNSTPFVDRDGSIWLPTQDGALHVSGDRSERLHSGDGLPFKWVRTVFRDREGTLWVLGPTLARFLGGGRVRNYSLSAGTSGEIVWAMLRDRAGRMLVGTDDGAAALGEKGLERIPGTEGRRIKAMAIDRGDTLWMVSTIGPALWLRPGGIRAETPALGEFGSGLNSVKEDSKGQIWLGHSRHGLLRWDPSAGRLFQEVGPEFARAEHLGAFAILEDAQGRLWVGTSAGLLVRGPEQRWRLFTEKDGLRPNTVRGLAFLPDGSAWIHYQEPQGLTRVRLDGDRFSVLDHRTTKNGLRTNLIYAVQVDLQGQVWVTTDQGLDRLEPKLHVGRHDGMVSEDCSIHALLLEPDLVWVGTSGGLVAYDPTQPAKPPAPPEARVLQATFGGKLLEPPFPALDAVSFRHNTVEIRVAAPTYLNERQLRFQVRLAGLEDEWRDLEGRMVHYPALAGGDYRFEVRAAQSDGPFGPVAALEFTIRPPWWKTWWCYALEGLGVMGVLVGIFRLRVAALAQSKAELEILVGDRTEELRTRNEELSAALDHVKQLSGLLPICASCKKIRDDHGAWTQLESYITQHSEADFTHGICPECARDFYPEFGASKGQPPEA